MEIASEMAQIVLEMRDTSQNASSKKQRLEVLAQRFLQMTQPHREPGSIDSIGIGNRRPGGVNLTM